MATRQTTPRHMKSILGAGAFALGLFLLVVNLDGLAAQIGNALEQPAKSLGILPALALVGLHAVQSYACDHAGFLSSLLRILVSFWPVLLIVAGALLLHDLFRGPFPYTGSATGNVDE